MKLIEEKPITVVEAKSILSKLEKERESLGYEQKITLDFMKAYVQLSEKDVEETKKELKEKLPELKDHHVVMLLNILPETVEDVKILFSKERIELDENKINQILEVLDKIRPAEKIKYKAFSGVKAEEKDEESASKEPEEASENKEE